jgi:hypothetical protein
MSSIFRDWLSFLFLAFAVISMSVTSKARASASVVAAGIVAIMVGAFAALSLVIVLVGFHFAAAPGLAIPRAIRPFVYIAWMFFLACGLFVIIAGVQLVRLRNWARVALLIVGGCMLFFGVIGTGVIFFTIYVTPADPSVSKPILATVLAFIYGLPVVVGLWWLILLTRRPVVEQFQAAALPSPSGGAPVSSSSPLNNPKCPLPIRIVGWYLASFILFLPIIPFLPMRFPAYYFGHLFRGPSATLILFLNFALLSVLGIALLLLKSWSYPLALASQLIFCVNSLFAAFSPSFDSVVRDTLSSTPLPALPGGVEPLVHYMRYFNLLGLVPPLAIVITLCFSGRSFYSAARCSGTPS